MARITAFENAVDAYQQCLRSTFDDSGKRVDNITDWALDQFKKHYQPGRAKPKRPITKEAIFHYVYGVLHDPVYREKYALNLKREFPRIPFYADFWQWADWGKALMDLHIGYETVEPFELERIEAGHPTSARRRGAEGGVLARNRCSRPTRKPAASCSIRETTLAGVPPEAWDYKLGNRSALEWILDQYKEKKPKDPTIREKFDTYRFADYKEKVIDLLMRVVKRARWASSRFRRRSAIPAILIRITRPDRGHRSGLHDAAGRGGCAAPPETPRGASRDAG